MSQKSTLCIYDWHEVPVIKYFGACLSSLSTSFVDNLSGQAEHLSDTGSVTESEEKVFVFVFFNV